MYDIRFMTILYSHCSTVALLKNIKSREHAEAMNEICFLRLKIFLIIINECSAVKILLDGHNLTRDFNCQIAARIKVRITQPQPPWPSITRDHRL